MKKAICLFIAIMLLFCVISCDGTDTGSDGTTDATTTENVTDITIADTVTTDVDTTDVVSTDTDKPEETSLSEATDTSASETTAEITTEPDVPEVMNDFGFSSLTSQSVGQYFKIGNHCTASVVNDESCGQVLKLETTEIGSVGTSDPHICFYYKTFSDDIGSQPVNTTDVRYIVLKVRHEGTWSRVFRIYWAAKSSGFTDAASAIAVMSADAGWQYLVFDAERISGKLTVFRFDFELAAKNSGEAVYISEMKLLGSDADISAYSSDDTYPLDAQSTTLKIMQFNIQTQNGTSTDTLIRAELYRNLLDEYMPDIVGMQEVTPLWRMYLDSVTFNSCYAGVGEERVFGSESNPIYYRTDKYNLLYSGTFWLSATPSVPGSSVENANYPRICTWIKLENKETGKVFVHLNTHLDHNGNNNSTVGGTVRKAQMKVLLEFAASLGDIPMFLTGDLNQTPTTSDGTTYALHKYITGEKEFTTASGATIRSNFTNSRFTAPDNMPEGECATMLKYYQKDNTAYNPAHGPIDYIYYTAPYFDAVKYKIVHYELDGLYISDHLALYREFTIK